MTDARAHNSGGSASAAQEHAARELERLAEETLRARLTLRQVERDIEQAQDRFAQTQAAQLLEANENLVLAVLRARSDAETATMALSEASHSGEFDTLTQLPNRVLLHDRFTQAIANARRRHARLALMFLDLNNFKQINDTLGHAMGDKVLQLVATRLQSAVRAADTVSRHGGDEFVILLSEVTEPADAGVIALKILSALGAPSRVGDHVVRLTASIGICIYPDDGHDPDVLIDRADAAMYRAKSQGVASFVFCGDDGPLRHGPQPVVLAALQRPLTQHGATLDEHERRHAQLREANEQLVLATLGAQQLLAAAEQARQRQTDLLAMVAHELRNPLAPIRTAAALLGRVKVEELARLQGIIERQVLRVSRLASDLLDVSRVRSGKLRLQFQPMDLKDVLDEAVDMCRPAMDLRLQRLRVQLPARKLLLQGDPARLAQVFGNLLDNASKYSPDGGEVSMCTMVDGDAVVTTVSDNGIGMTAQALPDVFGPFMQEPHAVNFNGAGLGLGLTVVRELVQAHGGTVTASSAGPGLGSQFVVTLKLAGESPGSPT